MHADLAEAPFLGLPNVRLALSAPILAEFFGRVLTAEVALLQRNSTRASHAVWTLKHPSTFSFECHYYLRDTRLAIYGRTRTNLGTFKISYYSVLRWKLVINSSATT